MTVLTLKYLEDDGYLCSSVWSRKRKGVEDWVKYNIRMATPLQLSPPAFLINNTNFNRFSTFTIQSTKSSSRNPTFNPIRATKDKTSSSADEVTNKYGLEAGLWKIFSSTEEDGETKKSKGEQAKELLAKYGGAYLATSITLSLISFSLCYALVTAGVDVQALLLKVGISTDATGEKLGTFALAYAAHKAASPIRFPPTVALTPIVAGWIGKKVDQDKQAP